MIEYLAAGLMVANVLTWVYIFFTRPTQWERAKFEWDENEHA